MHRAKPVAGMLDDYFIIIKRVRDRSHLIQRKSELLGVKYNGNEYVTAQDGHERHNSKLFECQEARPSHLVPDQLHRVLGVFSFLPAPRARSFDVRRLVHFVAPRAASDFERPRRYRRDLYCPKAASPGLGLSGIEGCQHPNAPSVVRSL